MRKYLIRITLLPFILLTSELRAGNPLVPDVGMADPHIHIFNDKAYLYSTHDAGGPKSKNWNMPDWNIWSSDDLVSWKHERTVSPTETYIGKSTNCWAPDAAGFKGKYYLYLSNHTTNTAVMVSDSPAGPFKDALGKPLLPKDLTPGLEYDITVLVDKGVPYLGFGSRNKKTGYYVVKLNDDMISLAEKPRKVEVVGDLPTTDKPDIVEHNGRYYLMAGANYAIGDNVYGPFTSRPTVGDDSHPYGMNKRGHGKMFDWHNQTFFTWCRFLSGKGNEFKYRESIMTYVHFKESGDIVYDQQFLDAHLATGVGQYDASWDKIEAEWYMAAEGAAKHETPNNGFVVQTAKSAASLTFPNVRNLKANSKVTFSVASQTGGTIEVRTGKDAKTLLGTCMIPATIGLTEYQEISCPLKNAAGDQDISLHFSGVMHLDWFKYN